VSVLLVRIEDASIGLEYLRATFRGGTMATVAIPLIAVATVVAIAGYFAATSSIDGFVL
jgi:hypothetical protein